MHYITRDSSRVEALLHKAYENLHGHRFAEDPNWWDALLVAGANIIQDPRLEDLAERDFVKLFEDVISISKEEYLLAQKHIARATSSLYLGEMARDSFLQKQRDASELHIADAVSTVMTVQVDHGGTIAPADESQH